MKSMHLRLPEDVHGRLMEMAARRKESAQNLARRMIAGNVPAGPRAEEEEMEEDEDRKAGLVRIRVGLTESEFEEVERRRRAGGERRGPWVARVVREALTNRRQHFSREERGALERINVTLDEMLMVLVRFERGARREGETPVMSADSMEDLDKEVRRHMRDVRALLEDSRLRKPIE